MNIKDLAMGFDYKWMGVIPEICIQYVTTMNMLTYVLRLWIYQNTDVTIHWQLYLKNHYLPIG